MRLARLAGMALQVLMLGIVIGLTGTLQMHVVPLSEVHRTLSSEFKTVAQTLQSVRLVHPHNE